MKFMCKKIVSIVLSAALMVSLLGGCSFNKEQQPEVPVINQQEIIEETVERILDELDNNTAETTEEFTDYKDVLDSGNMLADSDLWEEYVGDVETIVCGLISNQISYFYDAFPASVVLESGTEVFGIGYTDYEECFVSEDETEICFMAGFIPYSGEIVVPDEQFDQGLFISDLDYPDDNTSFLWGYKSDSYVDHCVIYNQYVQYGIDENGAIFYEAEDYTNDLVDESIGSLYSYDKERYLLDFEVGEFVSVTGTSLVTEIDYTELENEINRILEEQDINLITVDLETSAYIAQEAVTAYLLSMQEETFLGYNVSELVELASELDPLECYRITSDGLLKFPVDEGDEEATTTCKWILGSVTAVAAIAGAVCSCVFIECPPLSAATGAVSGLAMEIFMQVVFESKAPASVDWLKVGISAATGALSGYAGPYVYAQYGTKFATYFMVDSAIDGLIAGAEKALFAWIDGEDGIEILKSFGCGVALGFGVSAAFKGIGKACEKLAENIGPAVEKAANKIAPKLAKKLSKIGSSVDDVLVKFKKVADSSPFHSEYISKKIANNQLIKLQEEATDELAEKAFKALKKEDIFDLDGNLLTKNELRALFDAANDGDVIGYFEIDGEVVKILKKYSAVGVLFDETKYQTVILKDGLIDDRNINFEEAAEMLKKSWIEDASKMPDSIRSAIEEAGLDIESIEAKKLVDIIQKSDYVLHENLDGKTITLVLRSVHDKAKGGIAHMGGYGLIKYIKEKIATDCFDRLLAAAATMFAESV